MTEVLLGEHDNLDRALKLFKRKLLWAGLFKEIRRRKYYVKPSAARVIKAAAARRRKRKMRMMQDAW